MKYFTLSLILLTFLTCCKKGSDSSSSPVITPTVPNPPSDLQLTSLSSSKIKITWKDNSSDESGFKIERKTSVGDYSVIATINENTTQYIDSNLQERTQYYYKVYAYNNVGKSVTEVSSSVTTDAFLESITIGNQVWSLKNLDVTTYNNGDPIPQVTDSAQWVNLTTGAWCYYNNDPANGPIYGKLYNWYAVTDPRGLAPQGWHIPTNSEWTVLTDFLGGNSVSGGKMKSLNLWNAPNIGATNSSGFTGLPGGGRDISFVDLKSNGFFWSVTTSSTLKAWGRDLQYLTQTTDQIQYETYLGMSVRCLK